jgi:hypothetical protein
MIDCYDGGQSMPVFCMRYDIEFRPVAGCIVSQSLVSYVGAYDDVSSAAAIHKFGHDVFKESAAEARTNWERTAAIVKFGGGEASGNSMLGAILS